MARLAISSAGFIDLDASRVDYHKGELLLIEDDRILGFEKKARPPDGFDLLDHADLYCLPGLVDTAFLPALMAGEDLRRPERFGEAVWQARQTCRAWLQSGVTTAASLGAADRLDIDLAQSIASGRIPGPYLLPALSPLVPAGSANFHRLYGVVEISGVEDARQAARQVIKDGAERIVLYADVPLQFHPDPRETSRERLGFSLQELKEIVTQARHAGCYVHAQAISANAIENCIQAGVRSIGCAFELQAEQISRMASEKVALAPNLALGATVQEFGAAAGLSEETIQMVNQQRVSSERLLDAHLAGVEIICGTNAAFLQGSVARECQELACAGLPEIGILRSATSHAARCLKPYSRSGAFHPQFRADFVFLGADPTRELGALEDVRALMLGGHVIEVQFEGKEGMPIQG